MRKKIRRFIGKIKILHNLGVLTDVMKEIISQPADESPEKIID